VPSPARRPIQPSADGPFVPATPPRRPKSNAWRWALNVESPAWAGLSEDGRDGFRTCDLSREQSGRSHLTLPNSALRHGPCPLCAAGTRGRMRRHCADPAWLRQVSAQECCSRRHSRRVPSPPWSPSTAHARSRGPSRAVPSFRDPSKSFMDAYAACAVGLGTGRAVGGRLRPRTDARRVPSRLHDGPVPRLVSGAARGGSVGSARGRPAPRPRS